MMKVDYTAAKAVQEWNTLAQKIKVQFNKDTLPDLNAVLFLIGVRELGIVKHRFSKEEKEDLMHIAVCRLLSQDGYYKLQGTDQDGWPHWDIVKKLPEMKLNDQEYLLKKHIIRYFETEDIF